MEPVKVRIDEEGRLQALHSYGVLDTGSEERFDELARRSAAALQAPMALLSLVDRDRQFFKARVGLDLSETPRSQSFCAHAIEQPGTFVVEDALRDPRFRDNALVTGSPFIRFYAGAPLVSDAGMALGTLCVLDTQPRALSTADESLLTALGREAMLRLELRRLSRLRDFFAGVLDGPLAYELAAVRDAGAALVFRPLQGGPPQAGARLLLHAQRADDLRADLATIGREALPLRRAPTDLSILCRQLCDALGADGLRLEVAGDCSGSWDRDQLSRALAQLLESALARAGGEPVCCRLRGDAAGVRLEIREPPLPAAGDLAAFFEGGGGGPLAALGSRLAHRIVLAHGGKAEALHAPDAFVVRVTLPRAAH